MIRNPSVDLLLVLLATVVGAAMAFAPTVNNPVRILSSLLFVLLLPGYALMAAIFPDRAFEFPERLAFIIGLSLAVAVLGGLALNWTPWGLQTSSWAILLSGITISATVVALMRRRQLSTVYRSGLNLNISQMLLFGLAVFVVGASLVVAAIGALRQPTAGFTQLWIKANDGPDPISVQLGVSNLEAIGLKYKLQLKTGESIINEWALIELEPGETWETIFVLPAKQSNSGPVEALLYRLDQPEKIYRWVVLWRSP